MLYYGVPIIVWRTLSLSSPAPSARRSRDICGFTLAVLASDCLRDIAGT